MIIASTRRSQRQFRSTFVDAFEGRPFSIVFNRRARSEQVHIAINLEQLRSSLDAQLPTLSDANSGTETGREVTVDANEEFDNLDDASFKLPHFSQVYISSQGWPLFANECMPDKASQPIAFTVSTGDADAPTKISSNVCSSTTRQFCQEATTRSISTEIQQLLSTGRLRPPAQKEWEQLWYHGLESAFEKVAVYFPETEVSRNESLPDQSICEPALTTSDLRQEDRQLFEQAEDKRKLTFLPKSETQRLVRLQCAEAAVNNQEKIALLLGLPTYEQYLTFKLRNKQNINQPSLVPSKRQQKRQARFAEKKQSRADRLLKQVSDSLKGGTESESQHSSDCIVNQPSVTKFIEIQGQAHFCSKRGMSHQQSQDSPQIPVGGAEHRPLVVGLTKPPSIRSSSTMASATDTAALNKEIAENVKENTSSAAPSEDSPTAPAASKPKKEKAPKQPKPPKAAPITAPTAPALIDLRVGHILRAIAHPNADSLYVSTIAMGDPEGTEHTQVDEETGKVVRTVCSGLNGLVPLEEMQDRKIIVVANLKPVNMRSIKSAAMVLAASPKQPEGADPHAADRVVELVTPPTGAEAGDKVYFEGWPYGEGKGPEKQLNPKKKQWEAIQPGFFTGDDLVVGFDASQCEEVEGDAKGNLVVEGKGVCTVKTLKGAVVR